MRPYDEAHAPDGAPRAHYDELLAAVGEQDLGALLNAANAHMRGVGATFGTGADAAGFLVDPVPRLIDGTEWDALEAGLNQRVRALNAFVRDAYGEREIVTAGVVPEHVIDQAEGYEPRLRHRLPAGVTPIGVAGLDVVRAPDGEFLVLEDNCRAPSGAAYAMALRDASDAALPLPGVPRRPIDRLVPELLGGVLRDATSVDDPLCVVLTDGPENVAYWEHSRLAALTGAALVTWADVERRGDRLLARLSDGSEPQVDVLYRRCDEDRMTDEAGALTPLGELVGEPWLAGNLGLVNGLGTGVADDKLVHAYVEAMVRFYLGEEPALRSVPTLDLGRPDALAEVLSDLPAFVVKPRGGYGGHGVVICRDADAAALDRVRADLAAAPGSFIAQRTVSLSCAPTVVAERLEPRHVDLRPYTYSGRDWTRTLPGGLTRVAMGEGTLVVNSSQDGGAKDTWVLA